MFTTSKDETRLVNRYLFFGYSSIIIILLITYLIEVLKHAFTWRYYIVFLFITLIPFLYCLLMYKKNPSSTQYRYNVFYSYLLMYGYVLLTGHTILVFTYILPLLSLLILCHDSKLIAITGIISISLNILCIYLHYIQHKITLLNSRDYEIQLALLTLCFLGCYLATSLYDQISKLNKQKENEVLRLQEERIILQERNKYAYIDSLTNLLNRRKMNEVIKEIGDNTPVNFHVIMLDINGLKHINDTLGHLAGDELITGTANCIKSAFDHEDLCFRLGGDEFCIFSYSVEEVLNRKIQQLQNNIKNYKGIIISNISCSIGVVGTTEYRAGIEKYLSIADKRMYENKQLYYNQSKPRNEYYPY